MREIAEGQRVRHQFEHGRSFNGATETFGVMVTVRPSWHASTMRLDDGTEVSVFLGDLTVA